MPQHAFVVENPPGPDPLKIVPYEVDIYRNDQNLIWKILAQGWGWSPNHNPAIDIGDGWTGTTPSPVGDPPGPGELDRRLYSAHGPGPNEGTEPVLYTYIAWVTDDPDASVDRDRKISAMDVVRQLPIDPEVGNQPQP